MDSARKWVAAAQLLPALVASAHSWPCRILRLEGSADDPLYRLKSTLQGSAPQAIRQQLAKRRDQAAADSGPEPALHPETDGKGLSPAGEPFIPLLLHRSFAHEWEGKQAGLVHRGACKGCSEYTSAC